MSSGKVILGAIAGLATGAILGILFAPDKGVETRKKITKKSKQSIDDLKSKYDDVIETLSAKLASVKNDASHLFDEGKDLVHDTKREGAKLYEEGKDLAHDAKIRASNQVK